MHGNQPISIQVLLAHLPLFSGLGPEELTRISKGSRQVRAARNQILYSKGERSEGFYLIILGRVRLLFTTAEGTEQVVDILGQGQAFGDHEMLTDRGHEVSAQVLSDSLLLYVSRAVLFAEFDRDPGLRLRMLGGMARRLGELMADVESFSLRSGRQRVIDYFLHLLPDHHAGKDMVVVLPTTKANIASRLNVTQEHFSRILRELSKEGLIEVRDSRITVPDVRRLRAGAES